MPTTLRFSCPQAFYDEFERKDNQPWTTHYCPGCGHGLIHKYVAEAIDRLGIQDRTIFVSPVGCAVFGYYYFDVGNVQVAHGRCPAAATALKRAHPEAIVIGYQGDGDLAAIGGNEILHAANRGENVTILFVNNAIYGMTGGQMAPTSLMGMETTTTPQGREASNEGFPIRVCELLASLDAPFYLERVAVGDPKHNHKARRAIAKAIQNQLDNRGFSLVEVLSPCPTGWKRRPLDAARWALEEMTRTFPLGVYRDGHELDLGHPRLRASVASSEIPALLDLTALTGAPASDARTREMKEVRYKIAGFGGQGVLMLGLVLARSAMLAGHKVSWMPSYGPEMRGGTANCSVTLSAREIGSPLVDRPDVLVAMNGPSLERFAGEVKRGGTIYYNASMIETAPRLPGVELVPVQANAMANRIGNVKIANSVMLGAMAASAPLTEEELIAGLRASLEGQGELLELNLEAFRAGKEVVAVT